MQLRLNTHEENSVGSLLPFISNGLDFDEEATRAMGEVFDAEVGTLCGVKSLYLCGLRHAASTK